MAIKLIHKVPAVSDTERPAPRWALRLAYALPLLLLPSCLWRLPFAFHFPMGQVQDIGMPHLGDLHPVRVRAQRPDRGRGAGGDRPGQSVG
ncbi:hypothetical protein [Actinomadura luteofluorescens]|uniref:hypothetical protein n=1 Tax=Actinomadura luteofluorescens TaxID=46163 RepID=UPI003D90DCF2